MKRKSMIGKRLVAGALLACMAGQSGCAYANRGKTESFFDTQLDKSQLQVYRVAIIPNRLPLIVKEPEQWRKTNWELIAEAFRSRGFEVVDYESSNNVFREANLPIEDTGSSEEKFARAASALNADILIMPYYSATMETQSILMTQHAEYSAMASLQIYSTRDNRFVFRTDGDGKSGFNAYSGLFSVLLNAVSGATAAAGTNSRDPIIPMISIGIGVTGLIFVIGDLVNALTPNEEWWKRAFKHALEGALEPFFSVYPQPPAIPAADNPQPEAQPEGQPEGEPAAPASSQPGESLEDILRQ